MNTSTDTGTGPDLADDLASAYLDDELEAEDAMAFEELLESSPEVAEEFADLQKVISLVGGLGEVHAPEDFYEKLNRRIRRRQIMQPQTASKLTAIAVPLQILSMIVILTVAALWIYFLPDAVGGEFLIAEMMPVTLLFGASAATLVVVTLATPPPPQDLQDKFFPAN